MSISALGRRVLLAATMLLSAAAAQAADWPNKPVKIIYPYPVGSGGDVVVRKFADSLGRKLGQPFVVDNRPGAAGTIGAEAASKAAPDGYSFYGGPNAPIVLLPQLRKVGYDPRDFQAVAAVAEYVYGMAVLPSLGPKTLAELIAMAKAKPGDLSYSSPGAGSATNLRGEAFKALAGVDLLHVPFRGPPEALVEFLGGRVSVIYDNIMFPHVKSGGAVMLAVTSAKRHPDFPDVPTLAEAGYEVNLPTWVGFLAPKGTPPEVSARLAAAIQEISADPETQAFLLKIGFFPMNLSPAETAAANEREIESFRTWVQRLNFKIE